MESCKWKQGWKDFFLIAKLRFHRKLDTFKPDVILFYLVFLVPKAVGFFTIWLFAVHFTLMCSAKFLPINILDFFTKVCSKAWLVICGCNLGRWIVRQQVAMCAEPILIATCDMHFKVCELWLQIPTLFWQ